MKVAFYTDQLYKFGGIERVTAHKIKYLTALKDFEVRLITTEQKSNPSFFDLDSNVIETDLKINYDRKKSYLHPKNLIKIPKHILRLRSELKKNQPDIMIVCNHGIDFYFIPWICRNIIKIKEFHSSRHYAYQDRKKKKSLFNLIRWSLIDFVESKYDKIVVLTEDEQKYYKSPTTVIPNPIENIGVEKQISRRKTVISAGRLAPVKGFDSLIKCWSVLSPEFPDWKLEIYGDGDPEYRAKLEALTKEHGIENQVKFCGVTKNLINIMRSSSVYAMTSVTECFPMVLLEAMVSGLPIVSFDCPNGPRNIIQNNEDGILVKNQDIAELTDKLKIIMTDGQLRAKFGNAAVKSVKRFELNEVMPKWINLFNSLKEAHVI